MTKGKIRKIHHGAAKINNSNKRKGIVRLSQDIYSDVETVQIYFSITLYIVTKLSYKFIF